MENNVVENTKVMVQNMEDACAAKWPNQSYPYEYKVNRKYIKVIKSLNGEQRSVVAFVDKVTGDVYKPAGWNAPAKHARGNVNENYGAKALDYSGYSIRYM